MFLPAITNQIKVLLNDFLPEDIPNKPNVYGVFRNSELTFDISEGEIQDNSVNELIMNLRLRISLASDLASTNFDTYDENSSDLESLISLIIFLVRGKYLLGTRKIEFLKFQKFQPESGKFRAILEFNIPAYVKDLFENGDENARRIRSVGIEWR